MTRRMPNILFQHIVPTKATGPPTQAEGHWALPYLKFKLKNMMSMFMFIFVLNVILLHSCHYYLFMFDPILCSSYVFIFICMFTFRNVGTLVLKNTSTI